MVGFMRVLSLYLTTSRPLTHAHFDAYPILTQGERDGSLTPLEEARREVEFLLFN